MHYEDKEKYRSELQKNIDSVRKELEELKSRMKPFVAQKAFGRTGTSDAMQKKSMQEGRIDSLESKLSELVKNLAGIDGPQFGMCESCGEPIGAERREALPQTTKCIKCAQ